MESDEDKLERLMKIVREVTCWRDHKHTLDSAIARDIGCEGADAEELIGRVAEEFGVDFSDYKFYDYFVDETACSSGPFIWWLFPWCWELYPLNFKTKTDITVRHLYEAVLSGKWVHPGSEKASA